MTKVLLTGASGFAGHHCLEHLLVNTDWEIACLQSFRHKGKSDRITGVLEARPAERDRVTVITHDLTAPVSAQTARRIGEVDYLLAYASESDVYRSILDPVPFVRDNVAVILSTLEYARAVKPPRVVVVSTDEVYGPQGKDEPPHPEWAPSLPSNPYSSSKAAQEAIATAWWRTYDVPVTIVNVMNVIGERQDPEKFIPLVLKAVTAGREVTIHGTEDEIGTRHYLHARNMADGILFLLRETFPAMFRQGATRPDRYNIASDDRIDNLTLAQMIAGIAGKPLRWRLNGERVRPGHDLHYGLDSAKITALGWKPPVPFAESLEKTVRWTLAHPEWLADE